jgi:tRNA (cytidine/uridine-2'-O-)-methyltransferase
MFHVILFEPEIPPNAGNVIRLCANTGSTLHLVRPLGFALDDARVRRAGLDYHEMARVRQHDRLEECLAALGGGRVFAVETGGGARFDEVRYQADDAFLFGREASACQPTCWAPGPAGSGSTCRWSQATAASTFRTPWRSSSSKPGASWALPEADQAHYRERARGGER